MTNLNVIFSGLVILGAAVFLYAYHIRTRRIELGDREQVRNWRFYGWIDAWLKVSTLIITVLSLNYRAAWLLLFHDSDWLRVIGMAIAAAAVALFLWAMRTLSEHYTPAHIARAPKRVVMHGPYRFVRHPVYAANLWLLTGLLLLSGSLWIVVNLVILVAHYFPTIIYEERAISTRLPEYQQYARRTGRVFPKFWSPRDTET